MISETPNLVKAYHVTPKAHYRDNLKFIFIKNPTEGVQCEVEVSNIRFTRLINELQITFYLYSYPQ